MNLNSKNISNKYLKSEIIYDFLPIIITITSILIIFYI